MKILVVDDESAVCELVRSAMAQQGYQVWVVGSPGTELEFAL